MAVPFVDLKRDSRRYRDEYLQATERVLLSGIFSLGPEVLAFEQEFAAYLGVPHVVAVNGGTWALFAALLALQIGPGDEVIVPANSFIATAEAVLLAGAKPVFCDVDMQSFALDLVHCESLLSERTRAMIPVHLYGCMVEMEKVLHFAKSHKLRVIEDAAQAHGAERAGCKAGTVGDIGCFSFYPTKNLGALGEGGAVATRSAELASLVRAIRLHGITETKHRHDIFGANLKMEALQGAYLRLKLPRLDDANARRRALARRYQMGLKDLPIQLPEHSDREHVYHLFVIRTPRRDELARFLADQGISTAINYPIPIPEQPVFQSLGYEKSCPVSQASAAQILCLPIFPELGEEEVDEVVRAIRSFWTG